MSEENQRLEDQARIYLAPETSVEQKYIAISELKTINTQKAMEILIQGVKGLGGSALLEHEVMYAIGQMSEYEWARNYLKSVVNDPEWQEVVRHEAAEALGSYANQEDEQFLRKWIGKPEKILSDTCEVAAEKIHTMNNLRSLYGLQYCATKEPAAPFQINELEKIFPGLELQQLEKYLLDPKSDLFTKYRIMYFLRNRKHLDDVKLLAKLLNKSTRDSNGVLLKHEVCFILGQLAEEAVEARNQLKETLMDTTEHEVVRHEAVLALSSMNADRDLIQKYIDDPKPIVAESAICCISIMDAWAAS